MALMKPRPQNCSWLSHNRTVASWPHGPLLFDCPLLLTAVWSVDLSVAASVLSKGQRVAVADRTEASGRLRMACWDCL
jgi:hypothetical protein